MVNTRHSRDVEVNSPPIFLSLEDRKSRKTRSGAADFDGHESDENGILYQRKKRSVFEEKIVESRLRPRTGPSRSYNYVFGDSSDDEMTSRRRSRMLSEEEYTVPRRKTQYRRMQSQSSDEEDHKERNRWRSSRSKTQREDPKEEEDDDDDDDDDDDEHAREDVDEDHEEEDLNNSAVRRSSRLRRKPYRFRGSARSEDKEDTGGKFDKGKRCRSGECGNSSEEFEDMYSRVKRARTKKTDDDQQENSASNSDGTHDDEKNDSGDETQQRRSYSLREHKPRTQLYIAPAIEGKKRTKQPFFHRDSPPPRRRVAKQAAYYSPAHRKPNIRKRQAFHGSSSSTSSDSSDSGTETSDEQRFSRRKTKSMAKARARICPLNFTADMITSNRVLKDRVRSGASLADVDPMEIDKSVTFDSVGGLQEHIMKLKEMVVFPLLYPEFYERFKIAPSRGVLFYGPPGTGKTLVARALANECSRGAQKVAFFMRKGADCLSKWVGEAERQLRLLFDKAYEMRPSIIFFDEIDGLAPVRSSRQDQIHSSIVSTLLALMDGIDSRGEIVVIGATNRIDSIDPALRRPGRFDKEFHFPLPSLKDRGNILRIHTKDWSPPLRDDFLSELAEKCAGYCGADLKCLVTEATQNALRRRYPQIYTTSDKLQLDMSSITLTASDFAQAIANIVPAAQRAVPNPAMALEVSVRPLLTRALIRLERALGARFPYSKLNAGPGSARPLQDGCSDSTDMTGLMIDLPADEDENAPSIFMPVSRGNRANSQQPSASVSFLKNTSNLPLVFRPRVLVSGASGQGQSVQLAPAALHLMEHLPVHTLNSATLFAASAKMPEEACANVFHEAKRTAPSIIFIPYINELWGVVSDCMRVTFLTMIRSMNPSCPILILATSETTYADLDDQLKALFSVSGGEVVEVDSPTKEERYNFFHDLIMVKTVLPPPSHRQAGYTADGCSRFFPQDQKKTKAVVYDFELSARSKVYQVLNRGKDYTPNPRSKHTRISEGNSSRAQTFDSVQGSGGEGSTVGRPQLSDNLSHKPSGLEEAPSSKSDKSAKAEVSHGRVPEIASTSRNRDQAKKCDRSSFVVIQRMKCPYNLRKKIISPCGSSEVKTVVPKPSREGTAEYKVIETKQKNYLNSNYSASSFLVPMSPILSSHPIKRYPSRRSPYNKKFEAYESMYVLDTWHQFNTLPSRAYRARRVLEPLAKAPPPEPRKLTDKEQKKLKDSEEDTLRELRIFLRDILGKLGREKKFTIFTKPVDEEEVPDYYSIIKNPMDLSTMMSKIDLHEYNTAGAFLDDIFLICSNALEYNPDRGPTDRGIRHRACALRDMAQALLKAELDPDFERLCQEITQSRKTRGVDSSQNVPAFYHTRPSEKSPAAGGGGTEASKNSSLPTNSSAPEGCRYSRRVRGLDADRIPPLEAVERTAQVEKSLLGKGQESDKEQLSVAEVTMHQRGDAEKSEDGSKKVSSQNSTLDISSLIDKDVESAQAECMCPSSLEKGPTPVHSGKTSKGSSDSKHSSAHAHKKASMRKKCPWLATRRRRRHHSTTPHKSDMASPAPNFDLATDEESMDTEPSPTAKQPEGWNSLESHQEHSVSAANPANVNLPNTRTRSSSDNIPTSQDKESGPKEQCKQRKEPVLQEKRDDSGKPFRSVVRSLDMELMVGNVDSGISSESNGDSRDSLDHNNSNRNPSTVENHDRVEDGNIASTSTSGSFTRTRSRTQNPLQMSPLGAEAGHVVVDKEKLRRLLEKTVQHTEAFTVEKLQRLYSVLNCTVYNHRYQLDKGPLIQEMEAAVQNASQETGCL